MSDLIRRTLLIPLCAWCLAPPVGAEIFVKIAGIPGDVAVPGYDDGKWFEADSGSYGADRELQEAVKGGTTDINLGIGELSPIGISGPLSRTCAPLAAASISGATVGDVEIHLAETAADPDAKTVAFGVIKLTGALVKNFTMDGSADEPPWFEAGFLYQAIEVTTRHADPVSGKLTVFTTTWDLVTASGGTSGGGTTNTPPTISTINPQSVSEDTPVGVAVTVGDPDGTAASLRVTVMSSNPALMLASRIAISGSGADRSLLLSPVPDGHGSATITVSVSDGTSTTSTAFLFTVIPTADPPRIGPIGAQATDAGVAKLVAIDASDPDQPSDTLALSAAAGNATLLPPGSLTFAHGGSGWVMTLSPTAGQSGASDVTVTVTDATGATAQAGFSLTVNVSPNSAPTDILLEPAAVAENSPVGTVVGTLAAVDPEGDPAITYELLDDAGGRFVISSGDRLVTESADGLDFETAASHAVMVRATDSGGGMFARSLTVVVLNVNEAPVVVLDLPAVIPSSSPVSPSPVPIPAAGVVIRDPDAAAGVVTTTFGVNHGSLRVDDSGVLGGKVAGNGSRTVTVNAPIGDLSAVLAAGGLSYTPDAGYDGVDSLAVTVNDNGHGGDGGPQSTSESAAFQVVAVPLMRWLAEVFTADQLADPAISGLGSDADGDGLSTLLEYKLGKRPLVADSMNGVEFGGFSSGGETYFELSFVQRTDASDPDTVLVVQWASTLTDWASGPEVLTVVGREPQAGDLERVRLRTVAPRSAEPRQFFRFQADYHGALIGL